LTDAKQIRGLANKEIDKALQQEQDKKKKDLDQTITKLEQVVSSKKRKSNPTTVNTETPGKKRGRPRKTAITPLASFVEKL
jgi:hypothetical protein